MNVHFGLPGLRLGATVLTIGSFDGIHLGHRRILEEVVRQAGQQQLQSAIVTFEPHPRCVLDPANCPPEITTLETRIRLLEEMGLAHVIVLEFNRQLAARSAESFMEQLGEGVALRHLVVGYDFALGRGRAGTVAWLKEYGELKRYQLQVIPPFQLAEEAIHSSDIRRWLTTGDVERARSRLGRPFSLPGTVEVGDQIGRRIGWPTVNLALPPNQLIPGRGIYAGLAKTSGGEYPAAISIGYRPTFDKTELRVEAYLLDFEGDLYQQRVELFFLARLRDELRFESEEELAEAIGRDVEETRRVVRERRVSP
ncbi:MAG: bifunctional riboflavin kinase/FAD synthetase [Candidatus Dormibacteraceae bacterium]